MANGSGVTIWRWDQDEPFGNNVADEDPDGNSTLYAMPLRFPGQYGDKETNLHYNYNRDYDPGIGGYKQGDPMGLADGPNIYVYVGADPLRSYDSSGFSKVQGQKSIGGNDPLVFGINKQSTPQQVQNAIKNAQQAIKDPGTPPKRRAFLRAWVKIAKKNFTRSFCPPLLEDLVQALTRQACLNGDFISCRLFVEMGGEIVDPNEI